MGDIQVRRGYAKCNSGYVKKIYSEWLPQAKYEAFNTYEHERYSDGDTNSPEYESEIWIPVKEKA
jgi:AraC family transcriptional regulator